MKNPYRPALLVLLAAAAPAALPSCSLFGDSEKDRLLAAHQANAQIYYDGGHWERAEDQVLRGLAIAPRDYKLNLILAWIYLHYGRQDPEFLHQAREQFEHTLRLRSSTRLDSRTHLGYAMANEALARRHRAEADRLRRETESPALSDAERRQRQARAEELGGMSDRELAAARGSYERLVRQGEHVLLARRHLVNVASLEKDVPELLHHGGEFLGLVEGRRVLLERLIEGSFDATREAALREELRQLRDQEIEVRSLIATICYQERRFDHAVAHLDRILELAPTRSFDYFNRGRAYFELGSFTRARSDLDAFLRQTDLSYDSRHVQEAMRMGRTIEERFQARSRPDPSHEPGQDGPLER